jgi:hypothetical protein
VSPRLLDLFCGRWGWSRAFAARGWECVGIDIARPPDIPDGCEFLLMDVLDLREIYPGVISWEPYVMGVCEIKPDFIVASPPCEQFSVHGMKHFHKNPPYPELGIRLFNHTRELCEDSALPYVIENVRTAQRFVGLARNHCGPFYLWGNAVPPLMHKGIIKGWETKYHKVNGRWVGGGPGHGAWSTSQGRRDATAQAATIPPELANCVADYAERLLEQHASQDFRSAEKRCG